MKKKVSLPIFMRILFATLLPLILIFSIVFVTIARTVFQSNTKAAQEEMLLIAEHSAEQIQRNLRNAALVMKLAAKGLASMVEDSPHAREAALKFVEQAFENASNIHRIWIYFEPGEDTFRKDGSFAYKFYLEDGKVVRQSLSLDDEPDLDLSLPQYATPLKEGVPYFSSAAPYRGFGLDERTAYMGIASYPMIRKGKVIGFACMELFYRKSAPLIDEWEAGDSYRFIISEEGTILYAVDASLTGRKIDSLGFEPAVLENMKNAMQQNTSFMGEIISPVSGKESLIYVYPVGLADQVNRLFMYLGIPTEIVYSQAISTLWTIILTFLIGLLLFTGCLFAATRNIVNPIKKLTESANLIAKGQFETALDEFDESRKTRDEVYSLGCSLQKMLKELLDNLKLKNIAMEAAYQKMKMEEAAAAKNRFFSNMSHEIRTPMNVILGMSEILLTGELTGNQKKFVQDIKISSENLLNIVNDILDLSRLESGNLSLLPMHYDFRVLIENICSLSTYLAEKKGLAFRVETVGNTPDYLYGDDGRLGQVLLNILGNAIKFTEKGGVTLFIADKGETLNFNVVDTGIGIRENDMQYLFEPFKQIGESQIRNVKGSGLGLSICLNLVELMGGDIAVDSEYGKGSSFYVTIPKVLGDGGKIACKGEVLPFSFDPRSRVLVVDDSESNLRVAREFLKVFGITADTASSGAEAVTMTANSDYDLIFMDHMMPEMDGVETTHRIRAHGERQAKIPIIALTANAVIGARESLLASGIDDFLAKPIEKIKFQAMLAKWLPENLVIEKQQIPDSNLESRSTQTAESGGKADGGEGESNVSRTTRFLANISEIKDLDIPLGLSRMAGNTALYVDLLGMMVDIIPESLKKIDGALSDGITTNLNTEVHTLKGSLANLGAVELAGGAAELEQLGSRGDIDQFVEKIKPFRLKLLAFVHILREKLETGEDEVKLVAPEDQPPLEDSLRALRVALTGLEHEKSMEIITNLARFDWDEVHNLSIKTVCTHIKRFDYDAAMNELLQNYPEAE